MPIKFDEQVSHRGPHDLASRLNGRSRASLTNCMESHRMSQLWAWRGLIRRRNVNLNIRVYVIGGMVRPQKAKLGSFRHYVP